MSHCPDPSCLGRESSLCPEYPHCIHHHPQSLSSHLCYQTDCHRITVLMFKSHLFDLIMVLKLKSSEAGSLDLPERGGMYVQGKLKQKPVHIGFSTILISGIHWRI